MTLIKMIALLSDGSFRADWDAHTVDQRWSLITGSSLALQVAKEGDAISSDIWAMIVEQDKKMT